MLLWRLLKSIGNKECKLDDLLSYAKICMVDKVMRPYLEALV